MGEWYSLSAGIYGAVFVEEYCRFRVMVRWLTNSNLV